MMLEHEAQQSKHVAQQSAAQWTAGWDSAQADPSSGVCWANAQAAQEDPSAWDSWENAQATTEASAQLDPMSAEPRQSTAFNPADVVSLMDIGAQVNAYGLDGN